MQIHPDSEPHDCDEICERESERVSLPSSGPFKLRNSFRCRLTIRGRLETIAEDAHF